jgi:hypothetical protein
MRAIKKVVPTRLAYKFAGDRPAARGRLSYASGGYQTEAPKITIIEPVGAVNLAGPFGSFESARRQAVGDEAAAKALYKARMESSADDFVTLEGRLTPAEVHEQLNALMAKFAKK